MINYLNLANFSFLSLLLSMIFYWIQVNFVSLKKSTFGFILMVISNFLLLLFLILRWKESGHFPLSNLYESLMFLSWCFTFIHILLEKFTQNLLLSCITAPAALFMNAFATFSLPEELQQVSPLVPALQSNWLMMHVTVMILSYAALISGSLLAIAFLILTGYKSNIRLLSSRIDKNDLILTETQTSLSLAPVHSPSSLTVDYKSEEDVSASTSLVEKNESRQFKESNFDLSKLLDNLSYRIIGFGFPLLTIGILSGAVWANEAWGSYWSWDPKETWALLTWLIFAIYLHTRITRGWEGKRPAFIAAFGFLMVWICFLGVNLLGEGLHSYGWIKFS
jgi:cytochrome c-type biogenesis protein CcsB